MVNARREPVMPKREPAYSTVLRVPGFRNVWLGVLPSTVGDAMSTVAVVILAGQLHPENLSAAYGLAASAYILPGVLLVPVTAHAFNRWTGRRLLLVDSVNRCTTLVLVALLHIVGALSLPTYLALLALASITRPAATAGLRVVVRDLIHPAQYFAANALLSFATQVSTVMGPVLAGVLIETIGAANVIGLDGASFALVGVAALTLPTRRAVIPVSDQPPVLRLDSLLTLAPVMTVLTLTVLFYFLYGPLVVALPLHAEALGRELGLSGPLVLGALWSAFGVGFVLGGATAVALKQLASLHIAVAIVAIWGVSMLVVGSTDLVAVALLAMAFGGLVYAPYQAIVSTILQRESPPALLGGLSTYWSFATGIASPSGMLLAGFMVPAVGPRFAIFLTGAGTLVVALFALFAIRRRTEEGR